MRITEDQKNMSTIRFEAKLLEIGPSVLLKVPKSASEKLPSRGLAMVEGTINGSRFKAALEPDGKGSHWFEVDKIMLKATKADVGDTVAVAMESSKEWLEPTVPVDLTKALLATPRAQDFWKDITPMARWEWIRWIRSTKQVETRKRRIAVALSKLKAGKRRPCCFNSAQCTEPSVSHNGVLLEPTLTTLAK